MKHYKDGVHNNVTLTLDMFNIITFASWTDFPGPLLQCEICGFLWPIGFNVCTVLKFAESRLQNTRAVLEIHTI